MKSNIGDLMVEGAEYETRAGYAGTIDFYRCSERLIKQADELCREIIPNAISRRDGRTLWVVADVDKNDADIIAEQAQLHGMNFIRFDTGAPYPKIGLIRWLENCAPGQLAAGRKVRRSSPLW
jgi:DNA helicase-2/ATP-dependent DNA helicase PcrA